MIVSCRGQRCTACGRPIYGKGDRLGDEFILLFFHVRCAPVDVSPPKPYPSETAGSEKPAPKQSERSSPAKRTRDSRRLRPEA
jgi:hypothetical protein